MLTERMRVPKGISELELIEQIRSRFARPGNQGVELGIGDDGGVLRVKVNWGVVVTTDLLLEGRHFRRDLHAPESVGHRCIARGLSDIAAMGADPVAAFLSLGLPPDALRTATKRLWVTRFLDGFCAAADGVVLAGGDTGEIGAGGGFVADVVLVGQAPRGTALRRSGARVGDGIYVTGALGGAAAELRAMMAGRGRRRQRSGVAGAQPQSYPEARLRVGAELRRRGLAAAAIDISDGLSTDLRHLCTASGVGAEVWAEAIPLHRLCAGPDAMELALHGGEDYELLFTARAGQRVPRRLRGVPVTQIGVVTPKRGGVVLVGADGSRAALPPGGWEHFRGS